MVYTWNIIIYCHDVIIIIMVYIDHWLQITDNNTFNKVVYTSIADEIVEVQSLENSFAMNFSPLLPPGI